MEISRSVSHHARARATYIFSWMFINYQKLSAQAIQERAYNTQCAENVCISTLSVASFLPENVLDNIKLTLQVS